ncbi:uncharacterized protein BDZ83DRAFT_370700 [Colletotrichum acutatum]|uniref:Secreted protein n=1 Tax=Glomerella acutata TaxID=27357 RepID=A0AAD8UP38_GLOAC|nr:uncharacterized protein BDZ83DRAFT_370700 [Colletotrichum acutatum]KAK1723850.1 hypothetical protein BDZ83DRAFT_370700 [Colletotrichum acutatum]
MGRMNLSRVAMLTLLAVKTRPFTPRPGPLGSTGRINSSNRFPSASFAFRTPEERVYSPGRKPATKLIPPVQTSSCSRVTVRKSRVFDEG